MNWGYLFFLNSFLIGIGLAMDAFSVSIVNGITVPYIKTKDIAVMSWVFAAFQFAMPLIGWTLVHYALSFFNSFRVFIPWIALVLLAFIGSKMIWKGARSLKRKEESKPRDLTAKLLLTQGLATSIDALSVGFTISDYDVWEGLVESSIIGAITFGLCFSGVYIGKKFGRKLSYRAPFIGGGILIAIGIEIWVQGVFFG